MTATTYQFLKTTGRIFNSDQARTVVLTGNIHDLFRFDKQTVVTYLPLTDFLSANWCLPNRILIVYELNGPIRFIQRDDREKLRKAWLKWRTGLDADTLAIEKMIAYGKIQAELDSMSKAFDQNLSRAIGNPTLALELLRQMCLCSRTKIDETPVLTDSLIIIIEAADMVLPEGEISRLSDADRRRISIVQDWFSDPGYMQSDDSVVMLSESMSLINNRIARLPQVIEVNVPAPDDVMRLKCINWFNEQRPPGKEIRLWSTPEELAKFTAGLSIHALIQVLKGASYANRTLTLNDVITKVEEYIQSQLGEDIVEFKKPSHNLDKVIGFSALKSFLEKELLPRFRSSGAEAVSGVAVCGPIGSGKTFIFEAVATELDMIVLVLKNIRSQWFGQTDVIFERLRRVLDALAKVLIFVDEADTQFGSVGPETHATERRLTGKIQAMMSDPRLKGQVIWLLMTARIHMLSPDIRRPGRVGDFIIPILDPDGNDRIDFMHWAVKPVVQEKLTDDQWQQLTVVMQDFSAAGFAAIRSELKAKTAMKKGPLTFSEILEIIDDMISPAIEETRRYQTLQALVNCTRKSLLPESLRNKNHRENWQIEIRKLETKGIK